MEIALLVTWFDFGFLALAVAVGWKGYKLGKQAGHREAYQIEVNNRLEEMIRRQDSKN